MPKSKRAKIVNLTKVQKKPAQEKKSALIQNIQDNLAHYKNVYLMRTFNARNQFLKNLRDQLKASISTGGDDNDTAGQLHGKIVFGKHAIMKVAFNTAQDIDFGADMSSAIEQFSAQKNVGRMNAQLFLLFTDSNSEQVKQYFDNLQEDDYVRAGVPAPFSYTIPAGVMYYPLLTDLQKTGDSAAVNGGDDEMMERDVHRLPLPASMAQLLRTPHYGNIPTSLDKGQVHVMRDFEVCKQGQEVKVEMARVLKLLNVQYSDGCMVGFKVEVLCQLDKINEQVISLVDVSSQEDVNMNSDK
ncbi:hypothetical protein MP228_008989 [Amoeboaphelidium protococcarum]|nr:hypothetical protein MP228_008989 [Amoeboaphelidium protococcarum]